MFIFGLATALPNLHPALVHFPIALALTAMVLRSAHMIRPSWGQAEKSATLLTLFAALGACVAWLAGRQAVSGLGPLPAAAEQTLSRHADLGGWTVIALWAAVILSLLAVRGRSTRSAQGRLLWRGAHFLVLLAATIVLSAAADLGGRLVYVHGVAVAGTVVESGAMANATAGAESSPAVELLAPDTAATMTVAADGIEVVVDGEGLVALPGIFDDVSASVLVDPTDFQGRLALVHHAVSAADWEGMLLEPSGRVALVRMTGGAEEVLKKTSLLFPSEPVRLDVTAAAGHFKGYLDGDMIIHGHGDSGAPGRVALYFSGTGTLRLTEFTADTAAAMSH